MKKYYDLVFIVNMPAFYKIKLWDEVNKEKRIFAIFTCPTDETRNKDFVSGNPSFDYIILEKNG